MIFSPLANITPDDELKQARIRSSHKILKPFTAVFILINLGKSTNIKTLKNLPDVCAMYS